jgi:hypothetical protein
MDPRKAALQEFLQFARNSLAHHIQKSVDQGSLSTSDANKALNNFDERVELVLESFSKQEGGLPKDLPKLDTAAFEKGMKSFDKIPSEAEIQKQIDELVNFDPAEHIAPAIKPALNQVLPIFAEKYKKKIKQLVGTVFLLGSIEELPIFGPLIASSMDISTTFMPALAATFQNMLPKVMSLVPVPAPMAAFAGEASGYVFSSVLLFMTLMTQVTRGQFMDALESVSGLVPVVGTTLMGYVTKGKELYEKGMAMKMKVLISLAQIQGLLRHFGPLLQKNFGKIFGSLAPIMAIVIRSAATYALQPANMILTFVKPALGLAKARLAVLEKASALKKGGRYPRRTLRRKKKVSRKTRANRVHWTLLRD